MFPTVALEISRPGNAAQGSHHCTRDRPVAMDVRAGRPTRDAEGLPPSRGIVDGVAAIATAPALRLQARHPMPPSPAGDSAVLSLVETPGGGPTASAP